MGAFVLTRLAKAIAETKYSIESVVGKAHEELLINAPEFDLDNVAAVRSTFLHCFAMNGSMDRMEFIIFAIEDTAYIDTVSYRVEVMKIGPLKGKTVCFPVPDTFSDDFGMSLTKTPTGL